MRLRLWQIGLGVALLAGSTVGQLPSLPQWSPSDAELLKKEKLIPGSDFWPEGWDTPGGAPIPPVIQPELVSEPGTELVEEFPKDISEKHLEDYFAARPEEVFLVDPQELLSRQEYRDRESFLQYHAGESSIDLYVYLFDARQELPEGTSIQSIFEEHFAGKDPTALVFYYLGMPERSQLVVSEDIRAVASEDQQLRALKASVQEAFEKSDPGYQLDNFSVELSIRLYWFEKAMATPGTGPPQVADSSMSLHELGETPIPPRANDQLWNGVSNLLLGVVLFVVVGGLAWIGRYIADRRIRHVFPEVEIGPLLGAPHAAGVGAVISFSSSQLPPSQQRDQVPDYLQRM